MIVKLLTEHHLEFLSLKGGCTGLSESTLVKMPYCWKSLGATHVIFILVVCCIPAHLLYIVQDNARGYQLQLNYEKISINFFVKLQRGSYMSAPVLLNLLNELGKRDKMQGSPTKLNLYFWSGSRYNKVPF